jgi:hypothetical protein
MGGWDDHSEAARFRDVVNHMVAKKLDEERPIPKMAEVSSVDYSGRKAGVIYTGDSDSVDVNLTSVFPRVGQRVYVGGPADDRHIIEILGQPAGVGAEIVIPPNSFFGTAGVAEAVLGSRLPSLSLDGTHDSFSCAVVGIPEVWTSYDIDVAWTVSGAITGDMSWWVNICYQITDGKDINDVTEDLTFNAVRTAPASLIVDRFTIATGVRYFGPRSLTVGRQAISDVTDTLTGDAELLCLILYESI